jgi:hypothetical protein
MNIIADTILKPFEIASKYIWKEWGIHPKAIARQVYTGVIINSIMLLVISLSYHRSFIVNPILQPFTNWIVTAIVAFIISYFMIGNKTDETDIPKLLVKACTLVTITPLIVFLLGCLMMELGHIWYNQISATGSPVSLLLVSNWIITASKSCYDLFSKPLPMMSNVIDKKQLPKWSIIPSFIFFVISGFASIWWFLGNVSLEAFIYVVIIALNFLARAFNTVDLPPPGQVRQSKKAGYSQLAFNQG